MKTTCARPAGGGFLTADQSLAAPTGRWCAALPGLYPDRCSICWPGETGWSSSATSYVTVTGTATESNPRGFWRNGRCYRCSNGVTMKPYIAGALLATRVPPRTCDPDRNEKRI